MSKRDLEKFHQGGGHVFLLQCIGGLAVCAIRLRLIRYSSKIEWNYFQNQEDIVGFFLCLIRGFCGRESKAGPGEGKAGALFGQLLAVMHALLSPEWATWLRGNQVTAHAYLPFLRKVTLVT